MQDFMKVIVTALAEADFDRAGRLLHYLGEPNEISSRPPASLTAAASRSTPLSIWWQSA
jgi:hypothetical protein